MAHYLAFVGVVNGHDIDRSSTSCSETRPCSSKQKQVHQQLILLNSAAAAIAASGLLELSKVSGDSTYADQARRIVLGLIDSCVDFEQTDRPGLLMHGTVDYPRRSGVDESIMYGDHYFMEALIKLRYPHHWGSLSCVLDS